MCQQFEGEKRSGLATDLRSIREAWAKHESGECPLTPEQIKELCVRKMMLEDA